MNARTYNDIILLRNIVRCCLSDMASMDVALPKSKRSSRYTHWRDSLEDRLKVAEKTAEDVINDISADKQGVDP